MFRRFPLLSALLLCLATPLQAAGIVDVSLVDAGGNALPSTVFRGHEHVAGAPGAPYSVRMINRSAGRVLVVLSVDGVNAISGETAGTSQQGYVLMPWQEVDIRGWRKSLEETAGFYFTELPDSYAARTGRPDDLGVIGAAVFRELQPPPVQSAPPVADESRRWGAREGAAARAAKPSAQSKSNSESRREREAQADSAAAAAPLGTGHGERRFDPASTTAFQRASSTPSEVVRVYYDRYESLVARGIWPQPPSPYAQRAPRAFPGGFTPDPW